MKAPPLGEIDPGIRHLVGHMYAAGIPTVSSCEGYEHSEHATAFPTVVCRVGPGEMTQVRDRIVTLLRGLGVKGYSITEEVRYDYQEDPWAWRHHVRVVLTLWDPWPGADQCPCS